MKNLYASFHLYELDEAIKHTERVVNGSSVNKKQWVDYRHELLKLMLKHQLLEFDKNN